MLAIDTNVLVRFLTGDHPEQSPIARDAIAANPVYLTLTVALETEWVLRSAYGFAAAQIAVALRGFAGMPQVTVEQPNRLALALDRAEQGMDFADALHLGGTDQCSAMITFDKRFIATAKGLGGTPVHLP